MLKMVLYEEGLTCSAQATLKTCMIQVSPDRSGVRIFLVTATPQDRASSRTELANSLQPEPTWLDPTIQKHWTPPKSYFSCVFTKRFTKKRFRRGMASVCSISQKMVRHSKLPDWKRKRHALSLQNCPHYIF
jgi:hypothetical protein